MTTVDWQQRLRDAGYRITVQRELVYEAVVALEHATPDALLLEVQRRDAGVNLSTIYRNLDVLEEVGLVRHSHMGHGAPTYHSADHARHLHLVCRGCGRQIEVPSAVADPFVGTLRAEHGFTTDMEHTAIHGLCADCTAHR